MSRKRYRREETCAGLWQAKVQVGDGKPLFYCLTACWYAREDSNLRPSRPERDALFR